jgi:hypothetical protein
MRFKTLGKMKESTTLIDDVLRLILDEICLSLNDKETLLSTCLVSRQFYLLTVPYLYRNVRLDLTRPSHVHLVRRLIKPKSRFVTRIRMLSITGTDKMTALRLLDLYVLFARITRLQQLEWRGCLSIPHPILETLSIRFPTAHVLVEASNTKLGVSANAPLPFYTILNHVAGRQLTYLEFKPVAVNQLYDGIKSDLMRMLTQTKTLLDFRWFEDLHRTYEHPEMLDCFQHSSFPPLANFCLFSPTLFTIVELRLWGKRGGWSELTSLTLFDSDQLCAFVGQIPELLQLIFFPVENHAIDRISTCLKSSSLDAPFGRVRTLTYKDQNHRRCSGQDNAVVPWCMLEKMPKLETLTLDRSHFIWNCPGPALAMATAQDICRIRTMFPRLENVSLDLAIHGVTGRWPYDILEELALFKEPIELDLFLHTVNSKIARTMVHRFTFRKIFHHIVALRKSKQLPCELPFKVGFKVVRLWNELRNQSDHVDWYIWLDEYGKTDWTRYHTQNSEDEAVHAIDTVQKVLQWLGRDRHRSSEDLWQHDQSASSTTSVDSDTTLWDVWTS